MNRLPQLSSLVRRSLKKRQQRLRRQKLYRKLLSESLEDRRLLAGQPLEKGLGETEAKGPPQVPPPAAEPIDAFPREKPPAVEVADLTRDSSSAWQEATLSVFGTHSDAKDGRLRKVGTQLAFLVPEFEQHKDKEKIVRQHPGPLQEFTPEDRLLKVHNEMGHEKVVVDVVAYGDPDELEKRLTELGMDVTGAHRHIVSGLVPIDKLEDLADLNRVHSVRPFISQTASISTQGDAAQLSDDLRTNLNVSGLGNTIGVLSDSYDNLGGATADVIAGELPGNGNPNGYTTAVNVLSDMTSGGLDEGRAMLQTVHDIAPGAELAFATATLGQAAFAQSITDLHETAGANLIVDDVMYYAEPFFQDGIIAQAIDNAYAEGVGYFVAAGNNADHSYESTYRQGTTYAASAFTSVTGAPPFAGGTSHDFDPGTAVDDKQGFTLDDGQQLTLSFQWNQPFASVTGSAGASTDMDIYILNDQDQVVAASLDSNLGADAVEVLQYQNLSGAAADYSLMIVNYDGDAPDLIKYVEFSNATSGMTNVEFPTNSSTIYGHANAFGAATVGATFWDDTPEFGTTPPDVQPYSSVGGTPIYFDTTGNSYTSPVTRAKPDFTAPDGGNTSFFGTDLPEDTDTDPNFLGTSASAAHAVGLAALLLEAVNGASPDELYQSLRDTAEAIPLSSMVAGAGLIDGDAAEPDLQSASDGVRPSLDATTFGGAETISTTAKATYTGDDFIPVDTSETYRLSGWAKSGDGAGGLYVTGNAQYFGWDSYDIDFNRIYPRHIQLVSGSAQTTLAQDLDPGDTVIYLNDATGWHDGSTGYKRNFIWYGYQDSTGHTYPDHTYSRNLHDDYYGVWDQGGINFTNNTITLKNPWPSSLGTVTSGTAVGNARYGATYNYHPLGYDPVPDGDWQEYSGTITGESASSATKFRTGTAYIKPILMTNYHGAGTNQINWRNIEFKHESLDRFQAGDTVDLHVNAANYPPGGLTYEWNQISGAQVTVTGEGTSILSIVTPDSFIDYSLGFEVEISDGTDTWTEVVSVNVDAGSAVVGAVETALDATTFSGSETVSTTAKTSYIGDDFIPVDTSETYRLSGWAKSGDGAGGLYVAANAQYFGFDSYDIDFNRIYPRHIRLVSGSAQTTLAQDLDPGDTVIYLNDASGWHDGSTGYKRNFIWYGYQDSTGHTYSDYTYSRNIHHGYSGIWDQGAINFTNDTITLRDPWPSSLGTVTSGTAVGNSRYGATYNYYPLGYQPVPDTDWQEYTGTITGESPSTASKFRTGTAYIKPILMTNYHGAGTNQINWKDVTVTHESLSTYRVGDPVELMIDPVQFPGGTVTYLWTQTSGPLVPIVDADSPTAHVAELPNQLVDYTMTFQVDVSDGVSTVTKLVSIDVDVLDDYDAALGSATATPAGTFDINDTVTLQINNITFDNGTLSYQWEQVVGPDVTLQNADSATATFTVPDIATDELMFEVTVSDGHSEIVKDVLVTVNPSAADVELTLKLVDKLGNVLTTTTAGQEFILEVYAEDKRAAPKGVFSAYLDVLFDQELVSVVSAPEFSSDFPWASDYDITTPGVLSEAGAATGVVATTGSGQKLLYSATLVAENAGTVTFRGDPADDLPTHVVTVYGQDTPVDESDIRYDTATLQIVGVAVPYSTSAACGTLAVTASDGTINETGGTTQSTITISSTQKCTVWLQMGHSGSDGFTITGISDFENIHIDNGQSKSFDLLAQSDDDHSDEMVGFGVTARGPGHFESQGELLPNEGAGIFVTIVDDELGSTVCNPEIGQSTDGEQTIQEGWALPSLVFDYTGTCSGSMQLSWQTTGSGADYTDDWHLTDPNILPDTTYTFPSPPAPLTLRTFFDSVSESVGTIELTATIDGATATHVVNVHDACSYSLTSSASSINEGDASPYLDTDITITASGDSSRCDSVVDLNWDYTGGPGAEAADFDVLVTGAPLTPGRGVRLSESGPDERTGTVTLRLYPDSEAEASSTVTFSALGTADLPITITDDDGVSGHLEVVASTPNAHEPDSFYYCGGAVSGTATIQPVTSWLSVASNILTLKVTGTALEDTDYYITSSHTLVPNPPSGFIQVDIGSGNTTDVVLSVIPKEDADEGEGTETVQFELITEAANTTPATVNIIDDAEGVVLEVDTADATELNTVAGRFALRPADGSSLLCTNLRLIVDSNLASSASPPDPTDVDYELKSGTTALQTNQYPGQPGIYQVADGPDYFSLNGHAEVLIDVIPVDDGDLESNEYVYAQVEAYQNEAQDWHRFPDVETITIHDNTLASISKAEIEIDAEPDNECLVCTPGGIDVDLQSGAPVVPIVPGFLDFLGQGTHGTQPVVRGQFEKPTGNWPNTINVKVEVDDWDNTYPVHDDLPTPLTFTLDTSNYAEDAIAFAVPLDVKGLDTGSYRVKLIGEEVGGPELWEVQTSHFVINRWKNNDVAPGLAFPFLKQIIDASVLVKTSGAPAQEDGVAVIRGDNSVSFYEETAGTYSTPAESVTTLETETNFYVLKDRYGNEDRFAINSYNDGTDTWPAGSHYSTTDRNGNETKFYYDGQGQLTKIKNPQDRETLLAYSTLGSVDTLTITDFAGRVTKVDYDTNTREIDVLYPDPDPGFDVGPQPQDTFDFDSQDRLTKITRHANSPGSADQVTDFDYKTLDFGYGRDWRRLDFITWPDQSKFELIEFRQGEALPDVSKTWSTTRPLFMDFDNKTEVKDGRGHSSETVLDHRGRVWEYTDQHGQTSNFVRKWLRDTHGNYTSDNGEILVSTTADPDDFSNRDDVDDPQLQTFNGDLLPQVTSYTYDGFRNVTGQTLPDLGTPQPFTRSWSGHTLTRPTSYTNELNQSSTYTVQANGDLTASEDTSPADAPPNRAPITAAGGFKNPLRKLDVDGDGNEDNDDFQNVIDEGADGIGSVDSGKDPESGYTDTTGDGVLSAEDAVVIANHLNQEPTSGGSGSDPSFVPPPDQVINYTYTTAADNVPAGMVKTMSVKTGRGIAPDVFLTTEYEYYPTGTVPAGAVGLLKSITYAKGHLDHQVFYEYDDNGNLSKYTDEIGRETLYVYDNLDRLVKITTPDPDGTGAGQDQLPLVTEYKYDAFGNVASMELINHDSRGSGTTTNHTTCYYYDTRDRLVWQVDPKPSQNTTDTSCNVTSLPTDWDAAQNETLWSGRPITHYSSYDGNNNLESVTDPEGRTTDFEYDKLDRLDKVTEPRLLITGTNASLKSVPGEVLTEESGNPDSYYRPVTTFVYDNLGNLWSTTDSLGQTTDFRYDNWNRPILTLEPAPDGSSNRPQIKYAYFDADFGWIQQMTDAEQRMSETQIDFLGRTFYVAEPADVDGVQPLSFFEYFDDSQLRVTTDALRNTTNYEYDQKARLEKVKQPLNITTIYQYDDANQLEQVIDPLSRDTTYQYDKMGRVTKVTPHDPDDTPGGEESPTIDYLYDSVGNMLESTDALGNAMGYEYDHLFRKTKSIDEELDETAYAYDLVNNLTSLTDAVGHVTTWDYDELDRPFVETDHRDPDPDHHRNYLYDAVGNLRESNDNNGRVITYNYDDLYRVTGEQWDDGRTFAFTYDLVDNLLTATDSAEAANYTMQYDNLDRVILETQQHDRLLEPLVFTRDYDSIGNRLVFSANLGSGVSEVSEDDFVTTYVYDDIYRLTSLTQQGHQVAAKHVSFQYDAASQMTHITRYADALPTSGQLVAESIFGYDKAGRVTDITHSRAANATTWDGTFSDNAASDPTRIAAYLLDYDKGNRLESMGSWRDEFEVTYSYDQRDQLQTADYNHGSGVTAPFLPFSGTGEDYLYDGNGNRTSGNGQTYTTASDNQLESDGVYTYEYDAEGNRTKRTAGSASTEYDWDHRNRLVSVRDYNGTTLLQRVDYTYDVFNRRIGKRLDIDGDQVFDEATTWVYDGPHITVEFTDTDGDGSLPHTLSHRYLHGPMIDMILADEQVTMPSEEGDVYWPLSDHLGSVRDVVDSSRVVQNHVIYDAFGNQVDGGSSTPENVDFLFAYTGRDWDEDVDLQYNRARWYDPAVGRWMSEDPIGFNAGDANLYRYVGNESTSSTDPDGAATRGDIMQSLSDQPDMRPTVEQYNNSIDPSIGEEGLRTFADLSGIGWILDLAEGITGRNMLDTEAPPLTAWQRFLKLLYATLELAPILDFVGEVVVWQRKVAGRNVGRIADTAGNIGDAIGDAHRATRGRIKCARACDLPNQLPVVNRDFVPSNSAVRDFGTAVHQDVPAGIQVKFPGTEFEFNVGPGQRGPDVVVVGGDDPGFDFADLKPGTESGFWSFMNQLQNWPSGPAGVFFYEPGSGVIDFDNIYVFR